MPEQYRTTSEGIAALLHYLGIPMKTEVQNGKFCEFIFPSSMSKETCVGTVDLTVSNILARYNNGECEIADAMSFVAAFYYVAGTARRALERQRKIDWQARQPKKVTA